MSNGASVNGQVDANKDVSEADHSEKSESRTATADAPPKRKSFGSAMDKLEEQAEAREWDAEQKAMIAANPMHKKDFGLRRTEAGEWYLRRGDGRWLKVPIAEVVTHLALQGVSQKPDKDSGLSDVDVVMHQLLDYAVVDFAQEIAGYTGPGEYRIGNNVSLVTKGAVLAPLKNGSKTDFIDLWNFLKHAFPEPDQLDAFLGWVQQAVRTLRASKPPHWAHGVALIIVGESGIGKTSLQHLITAMLAGRATDPKIYFKGDSSFNSQLAENEHWMMSDPGHKGTKAERDAFLSNLKECVANVWMGCHPKGKKEITLPTFRRLTITLNPDPTSMSIVHGMEPGTLEKTLILDLRDAGKFRPDGPGGMNYSDWAELMTDQLPYFLDWLLNEYTVSAKLRDARYGVRYVNPTLAPQLAAPSLKEEDLEKQEIVRNAVFAKTEIKVLTKIGDKALTKTEVKDLETEGLTAGDVFDRLRAPSNPSQSRAIQYDSLRNSKAIAGVLRGWLKGAKEGEWVQLNGFCLRWREPAKSKRVYDFAKSGCDLAEKFATKNGSDSDR